MFKHLKESGITRILISPYLMASYSQTRSFLSLELMAPPLLFRSSKGTVASFRTNLNLLSLRW